MAGYSQRSLVEKLGIKVGSRIAILGAPHGYREILGPLPPGVALRTTVRSPVSFIQLFTRSEERRVGKECRL